MLVETLLGDDGHPFIDGLEEKLGDCMLMGRIPYDGAHTWGNRKCDFGDLDMVLSRDLRVDEEDGWEIGILVKGFL